LATDKTPGSGVEGRRVKNWGKSQHHKKLGKDYSRTFGKNGSTPDHAQAGKVLCLKKTGADRSNLH